MDVEALAVAEITARVARCPRLKPVITLNDKTLFTDGHIDLFETGEQTKANFIGRVQVQVKGRRGLLRREPKHPIARSDLLAFQKESGVLYFVVRVDERQDRHIAYYVNLSPFAIRKLLNGVPEGQATISVPIKKLPSDVKSLERIAWVALKTRSENVEVGFDPVVMENLESITLHSAVPLDLEEPLVLTTGEDDFALVFNTTGGLSLPVGGHFQVFPGGYTPTQTNARVSCGEVVYEGTTNRRLDKDTVEVALSEGLKLVVNTAAEPPAINCTLTLEPFLRARLKALEFFLALMDSNELRMDNFRFAELSAGSADDPWLRSHADGLRELAQVLASMEVDLDLINVDEITSDQERQLTSICHAISSGEEIVNPGLAAGLGVQAIGSWELMFLLTPGNDPGGWVLRDPFEVALEKGLFWRSDDEGMDPVPVTAYDVTEPERLGRILNTRLGSIVDAYDAISESSGALDAANLRVVGLISSADWYPARAAELLAAAKRLNDWLVARQGPEPRHLINGWQIAWREGGLSADQLRDVRRLKRESARSDQPGARLNEVACAFLLGDKNETDELFEALPQQEQDLLRTWPIWAVRPQDGTPDTGGDAAAGRDLKS